MVRLTTHHARSSYRLPVLVVDGQAYGPGDDVPTAGVDAVARAAETTAARLWAIQSPPPAVAAPTRHPQAYTPPATLLDCFSDPRDDEQQRVRDWIDAKRRTGK